MYVKKIPISPNSVNIQYTPKRLNETMNYHETLQKCLSNTVDQL